MKYFTESDKLNILDAGCGNGRDSFFMSDKHDIVGIDSSTYKPEGTSRCRFITGDFCSYNKNNFDVIYSRFTFHSITDINQISFLESIVKPGTFLCIETRSDKGSETFRVHGDEHFRNFTNKDNLTKILKNHNFQILIMEENDNFAIYKNENPICIRTICKKI